MNYPLQEGDRPMGWRSTTFGWTWSLRSSWSREGIASDFYKPDIFMWYVCIQRYDLYMYWCIYLISVWDIGYRDFWFGTRITSIESGTAYTVFLRLFTWKFKVSPNQDVETMCIKYTCPCVPEFFKRAIPWWNTNSSYLNQSW